MRPVEIVDALSKAQEVGRLQQSMELRPDAAMEFQKTLSVRRHVQQQNAPNPVPQPDTVVIRGDQHENERRRNARREAVARARSRRTRAGGDEPRPDIRSEDDDLPSSRQAHIDIKI